MAEENSREPERLPYDMFVDWEARLAREMPFFESLFAEAGVKSLLDAGCGSGMHAVAFAKAGLDVVGLDPSDEMLASARENAAEAGVDIRFELGVFDDAPRVVAQPVDAVIALGNGLPHVDGLQGLRSAISALGSVLRPGGLLILHLLNHEKLSVARVRTLPTKYRTSPQGDGIFIRTVDHVDGGFILSFITLHRVPVGPGAASPDDTEEAPWTLREHRSMHTMMPPSLLAEELEQAGFATVKLLGNHSGKPLDAAADESVIVVATKAD